LQNGKEENHARKNPGDGSGIKKLSVYSTINVVLLIVMTNVLAYFLSPILEEKITSSKMVSAA
tara:strand:- start:1079 stop:1267 length:189 start_codon:yes stop_codon:yes gene_type:complete